MLRRPALAVGRPVGRTARAPFALFPLRRTAVGRMLAQDKPSPGQHCFWLAPQGTDAEVREAGSSAHPSVGDLCSRASICQARVGALQRDSPGLAVARPGGASARESFNSEYSEVHYWGLGVPRAGSKLPRFYLVPYLQEWPSRWVLRLPLLTCGVQLKHSQQASRHSQTARMDRPKCPGPLKQDATPDSPLP